MARILSARQLNQTEFERLSQPLRHAVFVQEQGIDPAIESDGKDAECRHYGLWYNDRFVATARVSTSGKLGRMAVEHTFRRQGLGGALVKQIIELEKSSGTPAIHLHAQADAIEFYRTLGFIEKGERFIEAGIEHQAMEIELNR